MDDPGTGRYRHWGEHRGSSPNLRLHRATCTAGTPCSPLNLRNRNRLECRPWIEHGYLRLQLSTFANWLATRTGTGGRNRTFIRGFGDPVDAHVSPTHGSRPRIRTWNVEINSLAPLPLGTAGNWSVVRESNPHLRFGRPRQLPNHKRRKLVSGRRIERRSTVLQTAAMTTSANRTLVGDGLEPSCQWV